MAYDIPANIERIAKQDGRLDFKDEGDNALGVPIGKLTLQSTADPVFPDGRWVTKIDAHQIAIAWGVELFEF